MPLNAGDIVFDIKADDSKIHESLTRMRASFGATATSIGTAMTAVGVAVGAFATKAVMGFVDMGAEVNDMALRTGLGTTAIQELGYALGMTGGSLDDVEKGSRKLSQTIVQAGEESKAAAEAQQAAWAKGSDELVKAGGAATDVLAAIGLTFQDLAKLTPEDQFFRVAGALSGVENETYRVALAQQLFGRSGTMLLPILAEGEAGLNRLRQEAHELGFVLGGEAISKADKFDDSLTRLKVGLVGLRNAIGEALIDQALKLVQAVETNVRAFIRWQQANPELFESLVNIGLTIGKFAIIALPVVKVIDALVKSFNILKTAVIAVGAIFGTLGATVGAPVVIIGLAIANIILWGWGLVKNWESIKGALAKIWQGIAEAFKLIFAPLFYAWEKMEGMWLDAERQARFGGGPQYAMAGPGGGAGGAQFASAGPRGGSGGGGHTFNFSIYTQATNGTELSRTLADQIALELRARGV